MLINFGNDNIYTIIKYQNPSKYVNAKGISKYDNNFFNYPILDGIFVGNIKYKKKRKFFKETTYIKIFNDTKMIFKASAMDIITKPIYDMEKKYIIIDIELINNGEIIINDCPLLEGDCDNENRNL